MALEKVEATQKHQDSVMLLCGTGETHSPVQEPGMCPSLLGPAAEDSVVLAGNSHIQHRWYSSPVFKRWKIVKLRLAEDSVPPGSMAHLQLTNPDENP